MNKVDGKSLTQTLARVGTGFTVIGALFWVLWPNKWSEVLSNPEPIFVFVVSLVVWVFAEFKHGDSTKEEDLPAISDNLDPADQKPFDAADQKVVSRFIALFTPSFVRVFGGSEFPSKFHNDYLFAMTEFLATSEEAWFELSDKELDEGLKSFCDPIRRLLESGQHAFDCPPGPIVDVRPEIYLQNFTDDLRLTHRDKSDEEIRWLLLQKDASDCVAAGEDLLGKLRHFDPDFVVAEIGRLSS